MLRTYLTGDRFTRLDCVGQDITNWDAMLKDDYGPSIVNSLNDEVQIQNFMTKEFTDDSWIGRQKVTPVKLGRNWSVGSIGSRGALPQAGRGKYEDFKIPIRDIYGRVSFEKYVIKQSKSKKGSFAEVISQEMEGLVEDLAFARNIIGWGYGSGILAKVNGTHTATTTIEVKDPLNVTGTSNANRYLFGDSNAGMFVAFLNASSLAIEGTATITAYNSDGTDITVDSAQTLTDGDYVVRAQSPTQTSYNKEPEGLLAAVDDATYVSTYHNIARGTYDQMNAYVMTSVGALSLDAIQQAIDATSIRTGRAVDLFACEHGVRRAYLALLEADRRYTGADLMKPDGGTAAAKKPTGRSITYGDIPFLIDRDGPYGMLMGLRKDTFVRYIEDEGSWSDEEGSVLKWVPGYDEYTAFFHVFENYHCQVPSRNFRMQGITTTAVVVHAF